MVATGVDQSMLGDIYTGFFNFNGSSFVTPFCPTGDCAWNSSSTPNVTSYASLGVCGKCQSSTANLKKSCGTVVTETEDANAVEFNITVPYCNYTLPNGLTLPGNAFTALAGDGSTPYPLMRTSGEVTNTTNFKHLAFPFSVLSLIRANWAYIYENGTVTDNPSYGEVTDSDGNPPPDAPVGALFSPFLHNATSAECALYYCVQLYNAGVANGTFKESVIDTLQDNTATNGVSLDFVYALTNVTLTVPTSWKLANGVTRTYNVTNPAWTGAYKQFQNLWPGSVNGTGYPLPGTFLEYSSDTIQTIFELNSTGLQHTIDNLAHSMTNNVRESTGEQGGGIAYQSIPYVVVAWGWITLPASLLVIAFILLITTILSTKNNGTKLWKASSLAAFYHPLTQQGRGKIGGAKDKVHLDKISEDIHVKWAQTGKGWRLVPVEGQEDCRKVV
jgi:hypothetical protein